MSEDMLLPEFITKLEFNERLKQYPALIKRISDLKSFSKAKATATASKSLLQLDQFRFSGARERYESESKTADSEPGIGRADVLQLVEWKLKHGTFRPALMALCAANDEQQYRAVTKSAFQVYEQEAKQTSKAIKELSTIKGIGPATASLLLSIHDPAHVPFFSDENFYWMCCGGKRGSLKYTAKEYEELVKNCRKLIERLEVEATDAEKVAFVIMQKPHKLDMATEAGSCPLENETSGRVQKRKAKASTTDKNISSSNKRPRRD